MFRNPHLDSLQLNEHSRTFATYWYGLPKHELIPQRGDFQPMEVRSILPFVVIYELQTPDRILLRLAGTAVVEEYGEEITGRNYLDLVLPERRALASRALHRICTHPVGSLLRLQAVNRDGKLMQRESLTFPVRDHDGTARFVYACTSLSGPHAFSEPPRDGVAIDPDGERTDLDIGAGLPDPEER